jgi:5-deoxy-5-amino-3-dehydroquinate synthase
MVSPAPRSAVLPAGAPASWDRAGAGGRHIVLVGLMGSGKSAVGPLVARRLGRRLVDADHELERRAGRAIKDIFATDGEATFRRLESEVLADLLAGPEPLVLATGGGVVLADANRAVLRARATVVWLDAPVAVLAQRVGSDPDRPLLGGDPHASLSRLAAERGRFYRDAADHVLDTEDRLPEQVAEVVIALVRGADREPSEEVLVPVGDRAYPVVVGPGAVAELPRLLPPGTRRVAVVSQASIGVEVDPGVEHRRFDIADGEAAKSIATVEGLCRQWAQWGMSRADAVVAVGGGVVTDTAGFAAAIYHRGIPVVHVSTTLLGQVDAAIGGKTGVNLPEGKNLVGAFWQPSAVVCDTDTLVGLPAREYRAGMGELAKYHVLGGGHLDTLPLPARVAAAVRIKAAVVAADEREGGLRATLNYGHTLAHALETAGSYDLRHGEAVAIGLVFAAELAHRLERVDAARVAEHRRVVAAYGLDDRLPPGADIDQLVELMGRDKKATHGLTFVLDGPAGVEPVTGVSRADLDVAFGAIA